jgi:hypothetical protein
VKHAALLHLPVDGAHVDVPVLLVLVLLGVEHARHALDVAQAVDVLLRLGLRPDQEVREDGVVI